jgi:hypothetical protein
MIQLASVAALATVVGGIIAVGARDSRLVALGLVLAMVTAPLASSPEPMALAIAFRVVGALLAAYLLVASARAQSITSEGTGIGAAAELAVAAAAFAVGWFVVPVKPLAGPVAAQAAGMSLVALAVVPLVGRDVLRVGSGAAILVLGISLLLEAWVGPASALQQIALTVLLVGIVGATILLISPNLAPATKRRPVAGATGEDILEATDEPGFEEVGPGPGNAPVVAEPLSARAGRALVSTSRSGRTSRQAGPASPPDQAVPIEEDATARPETHVPVTGSSTRARRLRPREPRR